MRAAIAEEAAEWFVRNRGGPMSAADRARFAAWLKSSPLHVKEYLATAVLSRNLRLAVSVLDTDIEGLLQEARSESDRRVVSLARALGKATSSIRSFRPVSLKVAAVAAGAVLALGALAWVQRDGQRFALPKTFETARGEQRSWLLPDGTALNLDSDSAVVVRYGPRERVVQLKRGQALFTVAHESARRFRVAAGDTGVIAVGTAFDVVRKANSTQVTVVEGKVAVYVGEAPQATASATLPPQALSLSAGEQLQINDHSRPARPSSVSVQQALAWTQHQIAFDQRPLGEVADEFNRYGAVPIVIQSTSLRAIPISGVFSTYDADSFVAFIARLDGVKVERAADRIVIVSQLN